MDYMQSEEEKSKNRARLSDKENKNSIHQPDQENRKTNRHLSKGKNMEDSIRISEDIDSFGDLGKEPQKDHPIAVFDSGVGGISVLREMVREMPWEDFLFYGDSKNAPYGTKTKEEVRALTFSRVEEFRREGVKAVSIACNTATSAAVRSLRQTYPDLPIVGIEPAVKPAVTENPGGRVLVMATPMTIREEKFHKLVNRFQDQAEIIPLPCAGLMEFVEKGKAGTKEVREFLRQLLWEYIEHPVDAVVLGCTHYPFVRSDIQKVLGDQVKIYDGARGTARELHRRIRVAGLERDDKNRIGRVVFQNSAPTKSKMALCEKLLCQK